MAMGEKGYYKPLKLLAVILDDTGMSLESGQ